MGNFATKQQQVQDLQAAISTLHGEICKTSDYSYDQHAYLVSVIPDFDPISNTTREFVMYKLGVNTWRMMLPGGLAYFWDTYYNAIEKQIADRLPGLIEAAMAKQHFPQLACLEKFRDTVKN